MTRATAVVAEGATIAEVNSALDDAGFLIVGGIGGGILVVDVEEPDFERLHLAVESLRASGAFEAAAEDSPLVVDVVPEDSPRWPEWQWSRNPAEANWALEIMRVPAVWNLLRAEQLTRCDPVETVVGLVDDGMYDHPDLPSSRLIWEYNETERERRASGELPGHDENHAVGVAGAIAAGGAGAEDGIEGVFPGATIVGRSLEADSVGERLRDLVGSADRRPRRAGSRLLQAVGELARANEALNIINVSQGYGWEDYDWNPATQRHAAIDDMLRDHGRSASFALSQLQDREGGLAIIQSAGNDRDKMPDAIAQYTSPFTTAAFATLDPAREPVLVVEAVYQDAGTGWDVRSAIFSNLGGHVSAPGADIGTPAVERGLSYRTRSGTSFAAPLVAGVAALLRTLEPKRDMRDILAILRSDRATVEAGDTTARMVDALSAALALDGSETCGKWKKKLLDVDDQTRHGLQLVEYAFDDPPTGRLRRYTAQRFPDGVIDMSDFRSWRTAYHHYSKGSSFLPGDHPKLDLNGNGRRRDPDLDPEHHARQDFNGDGQLDPDLALPTAGQEHDDLTLLQDCFVDNGEGWRAQDLHSLVDSADVWIRLGPLVAELATHAWRAGREPVAAIEIEWNTNGVLGGAPALRRRLEPVNGRFPHEILMTLPIGGGSLVVRALSEDGFLLCSAIDGHEDLQLVPSGQHVQTLRVSCAPGLTCCFEDCLDMMTDEENCGACGERCEAGLECRDGTCLEPETCEDEGSCAEEICCEGVCYWPDDPEVCGGSCDSACLAGERCCGGACCPEESHCCLDDPGQCCGADYVFCGGVEVDVMQDPANCGECGNVCDDGTICCGLFCTDPFTDGWNCGACGNMCDFFRGEECCDGECVDTTVCGGPCAESCDAGQECCRGSCVDPGECEPPCPVGCGDLVCDEGTGICVDIESDRFNCGGIGNRCESLLEECIAGQCVIFPEDNDDPDNCGDTGRVCAEEDARDCCDGVCTDVQYEDRNCGACDAPCAANATCCEGRCVDWRSDPANCGWCGAACSRSERCCGGICVDVSSDPEACGGCGTVCSADASTETPVEDIEDDDPWPWTEPTCCEAACSDLRYDEQNCGVCGAACAEEEICCLGRCVDPRETERHCGECHRGCAEGEICCEGACADPSSDPLNCGECGVACEVPATCSGGSCICQE